MIFRSNTATENGGALSGVTNSFTIFDDNTEVSFMHNCAGNNGGAIDLYSNTNITFKGNSHVTFESNDASAEGGACAYFSTVSFMDHAIINFKLNTARKNGGAVALLGKFNVTFEKAKLIFRNNTASYGGAILGELSEGGKVNFDMQRIGEIAFHNNSASIHGNSMLIDIIPDTITCNKGCLTERVLGINSVMNDT